MNKQTPTILVVEDEKSLLKAWVEIFKREGLNVLTAPDGQSALNLALKHRPDLLVVDLVLSNSDGLTLIKKLKENKWGQRVPVMFLSGWLSSSFFPEVDNKNLSKDSYLHDNWSFEQVVKEVKNKLSPVFGRAMTV
jgi:DNA-binding response OmpR family regulator